MNKAVLERLRQKAEAQVSVRAYQLQETVVEIHKNAPRGGVNFNNNMEPRSAPGEPPATESETLLEKLRDGVEDIPGGQRVMVNYKDLENGFMAPDGYTAPRPMGAIALEEFKYAVRDGPLKGRQV
jgi:hypothetical protein